MTQTSTRTQRAGIAAIFISSTLLWLWAPDTARAGDEKVSIKAAFTDNTVRDKEALVLRITFDIPEDYHLYSMTKIPMGPLALKLDVPHQRLTPTTDWHGTKPTVKIDPNFQKAVEFYTDRAVYERAFVVQQPTPGKLTATVTAKGQICNDDRCIPFTETAAAETEIQAGAPRPEKTMPPRLNGIPFPPDRQPPTEKDVTPEIEQDASKPPLGKGLFGFIIIAFLAGLGALVTPCVFPMIPITVSFFSKFSKVSLRRSATMAGIYAGSIVVTFTLIGVAVSAIFGAVGMQTLSASVGFNTFLTLLLVVFAFNLFGLFEIQMPSWLVTKTSERERSLSGKENALFSQAAGVFFMAVTFTLVSFTCTVGFIGIVLAEASKGNWFYPAVGMFSFSLAFSLPFFFLALFPSAADKLRGKGGDWMVAVKVTLGFLELAGAFKFLSNVDLLQQWAVVTRPLVLTVWSALFLSAGLYLMRIFNLPHSDPDTRNIGPIRMFFAVLLLALAVYSASGIRDTKSMGGWLDGWLPPAVYPGAQPDTEDATHLDWIVNDIETGVARAKAENRPLFIDFTGYTCTNCRYMEGAIFPKPSIKSRLEKMVRVTAYTDCDKPICEIQYNYKFKRFDTAALPFYAVIDPFTDTVLATHPDMTRDAAAFAAFLDDGLKKFEAASLAREAASLVRNKKPPTRLPSETTASKPDDGTTTAQDTSNVQLEKAGVPVDFTFPNLYDGRARKLSESRGEWVLLNFWASWCAPCKHELKTVFPPALKKAPHIKLFTVAFDGDETKNAAIAVAKEVGLSPESVLLGPADIDDAGLAPEFNISTNLPLNYLIHPKGYIAWRHAGAVDGAMLTALFTAAANDTASE